MGTDRNSVKTGCLWIQEAPAKVRGRRGRILSGDQVEERLLTVDLAGPGSPERAKNQCNGIIPGDHTRKRRFVKVNMDEPGIPSETEFMSVAFIEIEINARHALRVRPWIFGRG